MDPTAIPAMAPGDKGVAVGGDIISVYLAIGSNMEVQRMV